MSFLFPKVNSADPKEAMRACMRFMQSEDCADGLLRREDVIVRDRLFEHVAANMPRLYGKILGDPAHPFHQRAAELDAARQAAREAEKQRQRENVLAAIREKASGQDKSGLLRMIDGFRRNYPPTEEEKYVLGSIVWKLVNGWGGLPAQREKDMEKYAAPFTCKALVREHLLSWPKNAEKAAVVSAVAELELPDEKIREVFLRYGIADGKHVGKCDIGEHDYVYARSETHSEPDSESGYYVNCEYRIFRCAVCGKERYERVG